MKKKSRKNATAKQRTQPRRSGVPIAGVSIPRVMDEPTFFTESLKQSKVQEFVDRRRNNPTPSESELERILNQLNGGVLRGKFEREHVISGKWIVNFFFPEIRLAIEVDGSIHLTNDQRRRDKLKNADCARFDITVLRIANREIHGNRTALVEKLRTGWREALNRKNWIIGMDVHEYLRPSLPAASVPRGLQKKQSLSLAKPGRSGDTINRANIHLIDPRAPKPWTRRVDEPLGSREDFRRDSGRNWSRARKPK